MDVNILYGMKTTNIYPLCEAMDVLETPSPPPTIYIYSKNKQDTIDIIDIAIRLQYSIVLKKGTNVYGLIRKGSGGGK